MPSMENSCSGTTEKPVIRSKFRRMSLYKRIFGLTWQTRFVRHFDLGRIARVQIAERRNEGVDLHRGIDRIDDVARRRRAACSPDR